MQHICCEKNQFTPTFETKKDKRDEKESKVRDQHPKIRKKRQQTGFRRENDSQNDRLGIAMGIGDIAMHWFHCIGNIANIGNVGNDSEVELHHTDIIHFFYFFFVCDRKELDARRQCGLFHHAFLFERIHIDSDCIDTMTS